MPKKTLSERSAPKSGYRPTRRDQGQISIGQPGRPETAPPSIIANSIFALTLKPKPGPLIFFALRGDDIDIDEGERIFDDLWQAYMRFYYLLKGEGTDFNPRTAGIDLPSCLHMAISGFQKLVPKGFDLNIERESETGSYYFILFRYCDGWGRFWKQLEVGHVLQVLAIRNKPLHALFLCFIRLFSKSTGIPLWDDGMMGNCLCMLDDKVLNMDDCSPDEIASVQEDIELYNEGAPAIYARKIRKAKRMTPGEIGKRAYRFKGPIANLIYQGCQLLQAPNRIVDYYYFDEAHEDSCYLELDCQANITWQTNDNLFYECDEYLNALAQEGVQEPVISLKIDGHLATFDMEELLAKCAWPAQLANYMSRAFEITTKFKKDERINGKPPKKSPRPATHCSIRC